MSVRASIVGRALGSGSTKVCSMAAGFLKKMRFSHPIGTTQIKDLRPANDTRVR